MLYEENILAQRLSVKNDSFTLINYLKDRYALSLAEAESPDKEIRGFFNDSSYLEDRQEFYSAIHISEPNSPCLSLYELGRDWKRSPTFQRQTHQVETGTSLRNRRRSPHPLPEFLIGRQERIIHHFHIP
jgi:hypothetical protein